MMSLYSLEEAKKKTLIELINEVYLNSKQVFIQSINKPSAVIISLDQFFEMQQTYFASLKVLKK